VSALDASNKSTYFSSVLDDHFHMLQFPQAEEASSVNQRPEDTNFDPDIILELSESHGHGQIAACLGTAVIDNKSCTKMQKVCIYYYDLTWEVHFQQEAWTVVSCVQKPASQTCRTGACSCRALSLHSHSS